MGEANYNYILKHLSAANRRKAGGDVGQAELARYRALESLLPDPRWPIPSVAAVKIFLPTNKRF